MVETELAERGGGTASGWCVANHLSPEYLASVADWRKISPGRFFLSCRSWRRNFIRRARLKIPSPRRLRIRAPARGCPRLATRSLPCSTPRFHRPQTDGSPPHRAAKKQVGHQRD